MKNFLTFIILSLSIICSNAQNKRADFEMKVNAFKQFFSNKGTYYLACEPSLDAMFKKYQKKYPHPDFITHFLQDPEENCMCNEHINKWNCQGRYFRVMYLYLHGWHSPEMKERTNAIKQHYIPIYEEMKENRKRNNK